MLKLQANGFQCSWDELRHYDPYCSPPPGVVGVCALFKRGGFLVFLFFERFDACFALTRHFRVLVARR